jgi:predicted nuclease of predicted toxin-antitoxin system
VRILADECCPLSVVTALRSDGHDVEYVAEDAPSTPDKNILSRALTDERIILTEDRDFCELVFLNKLPTYGIVLVRVNQAHRQDKIQRVREVFANHSPDLPQAMVTVTLTNIRIRSLKGNE